MKKVIVITGAGGMGIAIARRIGSGYKLILADFEQEKVNAVTSELKLVGYDVEPFILDVSEPDSVYRLTENAAAIGKIHSVIHTAGLSPTMADAGRILDVNLIGTAIMIEAFEKCVSQGSVGIMISSMAAHFSSEADQLFDAKALCLRAAELKDFVDGLNITDPSAAYGLAKRANILQVQSAAVAWGQKGARILSISPGIIATPMGQQEQEKHTQMTYMLAQSPVQRIGTPEDIAALVEFLQSKNASFITGTDILIDGGVVAYVKTQQ